MKRMRIKMIRSLDQLQSGQVYNLPPEQVMFLINGGYAQYAAPMAGRPSETKPAGPSEFKIPEAEEVPPRRKKKS